MAATKTKSTSKSSSSSSSSSNKHSAAQKSSDKARLEGSTGATRKSDNARKTKDERIIDSLKRPSATHIDEELTLTDVEHFLRDNPGMRAPDNTRRVLPIEEFPKNDPVRKAHEKAQETIEKAVETLQKDVGGVDPVLDGKIKTARRGLLS